MHLTEPAHGYSVSEMRALQARLPPGTVYSHQTALHLWGIPVPIRCERVRDLHVTSTPNTVVTRPGFVGHRGNLKPADWTTLRRDDLEISVTSMTRTFTDLATIPSIVLDDLIVAADWMVKQPYVPGRGRQPALLNLGDLEEAVRRRRRTAGMLLAAEAVSWSRVGADSPPETATRLALVRSGLPEPALQVLVDPRNPNLYPADLGYTEQRIALQYEGEHHRSQEQQRIDAKRDAYFQEHGWFMIKVTHDDLRNGFGRVIQLVKRLWGQRREIR